MPDVEEQDNDDQHEQVCAHNRRGSKARNSAISSEGEASSQHRTPSYRGSRGLSLSKSLRRRYLLILGLVIVGVMLAIVVLGVVSAMSNDDEHVDEIDIRTNNITDLPFELTTTLQEATVDPVVLATTESAAAGLAEEDVG